MRLCNDPAILLVILLQIGSENLEVMLRVASFLEVPLILEACCAFMRQALSLTTAVPLLMMASRYGCVELKAELVSIVLSTCLLQLPTYVQLVCNPNWFPPCNNVYVNTQLNVYLVEDDVNDENVQLFIHYMQAL
jgi:hypothetical protein